MGSTYILLFINSSSDDLLVIDGILAAKNVSLVGRTCTTDMMYPFSIFLIFLQKDRHFLPPSYYSVPGYKICYSVATLSYDNYYINLQDYSNFLLSGLL